MTNVRQFVAALAAAVLLFSGVGAAHAQGAGTKPAPATGAADPMANVKASFKARFGFTEAQTTQAVKKIMVVEESYRTKIGALQKKYGANPTAEQRQKATKEAMPLLMEMSGKVKAAMLSVATPAQRPKIEAQFKANESRMKSAAAGGKPKG
ncbi:MAG: hypothetical protein H7Y38_05665 [Armatimonadetes bacterium]|nr:hypothetical protein [Armatimonadota bacterium]